MCSCMQVIIGERGYLMHTGGFRLKGFLGSQETMELLPLHA